MTPARRLVLWIAALATACGGEERAEVSEESALEALPATVPAPEMEDGLLIATPELVHGWQTEGVPFVLIDARDFAQFAQEHVPGAVNIPYIDIRPGAELPPREARIVVYCSDSDCPISQYAYESLEQLGYRQLYDMREGLQGWREAGYPTEVGGAAPEPAAGDPTGSR
ncbi:MAG: rhodanese-like domain-containing protein [Gemmatimonadetes bacterium]|nr:rhodanese-like domain-containing protein [Gemmatimonadota bacterium]